MKFLILNLFFTFNLFACPQSVDLLAIGDSQIGATWSKSYFGNFLQECLEGNFVIYGRGATVPGNWIDKGGMDQIETIQRTPNDPHLNIGSLEQVPLCKKRLAPMLKEHNPQVVFFEFGGNYIGTDDQIIVNQMKRFVQILEENQIKYEQCYFLTPTYEMQVATQRNAPSRNLKNTIHVRDLMVNIIKNKCQHLDGIEMMKNSAFFDGKEYLKRIPIEGKPGCMGAAQNDNVHVCGEAAKDLAKKVCTILNKAI